MPGELMTRDEAVSALLAYIFSGAVGSPKGKGLGYALIKATPTTFYWSAALEDVDDEPATPILRYPVKIERRSKEISPPELIVLSETEIAAAILAAMVAVYMAPLCFSPTWDDILLTTAVSNHRIIPCASSVGK